MRASELSAALKEAFERRDELQRQIKDIRNNLEATVAQRNRLQSDMQNRVVEEDVTSVALQKRDEQIAKLRKELAAGRSGYRRSSSASARAMKRPNRLATGTGRGPGNVSPHWKRCSAQTRRASNPWIPTHCGDDLNASNDADDFCDEYDDEYVAVDTDVAALLEELEDHVDAKAASGDAHDDLMQIKGVGPAIAKTLHELGIFRFAQIAEMNEYDIDRVAARLKGFRSRIYREDWIGQARALLDQQQSGSA